MGFQVKLFIKQFIQFLVLVTLISCTTSSLPISDYKNIFPIYHSSQETEMIIQDHEQKRIQLLYSKLKNYLKYQPQIIPEIMKRYSVASTYLLHGAIYYKDEKRFEKAINILIDNGVYHTESSKIIRYLVTQYTEDWESLVKEVRGMY